MTARGGLLLGPWLSLLAACAGSPVGYQWIANGYDVADLSYGADHRDFRVEARGGPGDPARLAASIAALMPRAIGVETRFTATPDASARPAYRVLWVFEPGRRETGRGLCAEPVDAAPPPAAEIDAGGVFAVYCRGGAALTGAYGRLTGPADPGSPAFAALVRAMTLSLFPRGDAGRGGY